MRTLGIVALLFLLIPVSAGAGKHDLQGAWLQDGIKWIGAPPDINRRLQTAEAVILYFGEDRTFGLVYCWVIRVPHQYITISHGDPRTVSRGHWRSSHESVEVDYRLIERTVAIKGEDLPGPNQTATITRSRGTLTYGGKTYRRVPDLDDAAREAVNGAGKSPEGGG